MMTVMLPIALAVLCAALSVRSFCGKGFLLNNAYLFASEEERKRMNKAPYYRQSAVIFGLLGGMLLLFGLESALKVRWLSCAAWALAAITIVYAIASTVRIERKK